MLLAGVTILLVRLATQASPASAHPINTSAILLDITTEDVSATVELPLDQLDGTLGQNLTATSVLAPENLSNLRTYVQRHLSASDMAGRTWTTDVAGGQVSKVDGADILVLTATLAPQSGSVGDFVFHHDAIIDELISHRAFVSARHGHSGSYTTLAMLSWQTLSVPVASTKQPPTAGFVAAIQLGLHHIAEGSDHLLFLIMLLLPAPLVPSARRWVSRADPARAGWRVVHVVTAFAIGHSTTLALGALG